MSEETQLTKQHLKIADALFIVGVGLTLVAHFITRVAFNAIANHQVTVQQVAVAYEANRLAVDLIASFSGFSALLLFVIYPSFLMAFWFMIRKKWYRGESTFVMFVALMMFFMGLTNTLHDLAGLVGVMASQGLI